MPGTGQPRPPSGNVIASAEMTVTCSRGTPVTRAASATTGSMKRCGRSIVPEATGEDGTGSRVGWALAGVREGSPLPDGAAAEQALTTQTAASTAILATSIVRWYVGIGAA